MERPLEGKRVVLGVAGSIGAVQAPYLAARLRALGATVQPVMTPAAQRLVGPAALAWGAGTEPVLALSGRGEHVRELLPGGADALLVAPCTANTLGAIAHGLDDNPVTTFASVLLGTVPVLLAPAMHDSMWANPAVRLNLERARALGVQIVEPEHDEGAAKMAGVERIAAHVARTLGPATLRGKRVLVVAGPTEEPLGQDLVLSNRATGATGLAFAREAWRLRGEVELWLGGQGPGPRLPEIAVRRFGPVDELLALAPRAGEFDAALVPAAIGDYAAAQPASPEGGRVPLRPTAKFVDALRARMPGPLVAFKAEAGVDDKALLARARALQERVGALLVVANHLERVGPGETQALLVEPGDAQPFRGSRDELAAEVLARVARALAA